MYEPVKARPHATLLPNMGTCSRDIWLQQASFPTTASTGVWEKHNTAKRSRKQTSEMNVFGKQRNKSVWSCKGTIHNAPQTCREKNLTFFTSFLNRLVNNYSLFIIRLVWVSVNPNCHVGWPHKQAMEPKRIVTPELSKNSWLSKGCSRLCRKQVACHACSLPVSAFCPDNLLCQQMTDLHVFVQYAFHDVLYKCLYSLTTSASCSSKLSFAVQSAYGKKANFLCSL